MAQITSGRIPSRQPGLFIMQLRSHVSRTTNGRRRFIIPIDVKSPVDIPDPVKIIHIKTNSSHKESEPIQTPIQ
jgi:hypothetical protein